MYNIFQGTSTQGKVTLNNYLMRSQSRGEYKGWSRVLEGKCGLWGQCGISPDLNLDVIWSAMFCDVIDTDKWTELYVVTENIQNSQSWLILGGKLMPHWLKRLHFSSNAEGAVA